MISFEYNLCLNKIRFIETYKTLKIQGYQQSLLSAGTKNIF